MRGVLRLFIIISFLSHSLPAAERGLSKQEVLNDLQVLYPYFSGSQIGAKINSVKNPDEFVRTFVPYYYLSLKKYPQLVQSLLFLAQEGGWCVGDAHLENFGALLNEGAEAQFAVNDMDDAGPCPLVADILRFFVSVKLKNPQEDMAQLLLAYKAGLRGLTKTPSQAMVNLLNKSSKRGSVPDPSKLENPQRLLRGEGVREITAQEKDFLKQALFRAYGPGVEFLDALSTIKKSGGSFGLTRFEVLIKNGKTQIILFKQQVNPGVFPLASGPIPPTEKRILTTLLIEQGKNFSKLYDVQYIQGAPFLLQPLWFGNIKLNIKEMPSVDIHTFNIEMAYAMGDMHRKTAAESYVQAVWETPDLPWLQALQNLTQYSTDIFNIIKN